MAAARGRLKKARYHSSPNSFNAARVRLFRLNMGEPLRRLGTAAEEHLAILDACEQRQPEKAIELLTDHIEVSRAHTLGVKPM
jgi:DNA-binding GntR family transcriptional regulator